ncbi:unnamed protein product [Hydatigera taeniaeformis]|uniref:WD_REPEATS_REGION domain-containing protein n=1 Tax=Hydatigena taeniaeformis TaxID=6205 RepID=A0A0R3X7Z6_HYDTA|nr:unnamed protein product [Hydatigera taeniaeformis]
MHCPTSAILPPPANDCCSQHDETQIYEESIAWVWNLNLRSVVLSFVQKPGLPCASSMQVEHCPSSAITVGAEDRTLRAHTGWGSGEGGEKGKSSDTRREQDLNLRGESPMDF